MTNTPDELERAVKALTDMRDAARDGTPVTDPNEWEFDELTRILAAFQFLLSERAELLATVERMRDKVEGLDSDLRCAVQVAYLRGATEWAKRNYPGMIDWLETCVTDRAALTTGEANHKDKP